MRTLLFFFLLLSAAGTTGQVIAYERYTTQHGLPNSRVYRICKDARGFLWMSTNYGLTRYDGHRFTNYLPEAFNDETVMAICLDQEGRIWAAGITRGMFTIEKGKVVEQKLSGEPLPPNITEVVSDRRGCIWVTTRERTAGYISSNCFFSFGIKDKTGNPLAIYAIEPYVNGSVLVATQAGIYLVNDQKKASLFSGQLPLIPFFSVARDEEGTCYFGSENNIYTYHGNEVNAIACSGRVLNMCIEKPGKIWASKRSTGLYLVTPEGETDYAPFTDLEKVFVNDIYCDSKGTLFLGTYGKGLYRISYTNLFSYDERSGLKSNHVSCIKEDEHGNVHAGGFGQLVKYNGKKFEPVDAIPGNENEQINDLVFTKEAIWVATSQDICRYHRNSRTMDKQRGGALCLKTDGKGNILAGSYKSLIVFNPSASLDAGDSMIFSELVNKRINKISGTELGYYFATDHGVFLQEKGKWKHYDELNSPLRGAVYDIYRDSLQNIWMATKYGLVKQDKKGTWQIFGTKDGLTDNYCMSLSGRGDMLWVGTLRGLCSFNGHSFRQQLRGSNLPVEEISSLLEDRKGNLWIGTSTGLYKWQLREETPFSETSAAVIVTSVSRGEQALPIADTLIFPSDDNTVHFSFVSVDYRMPGNIVYQYRLKGQDIRWYELPDNSLQLSSLAPATYNLELRSKYRDSRKYSPITSVVIIIEPPVWKRWWFLALVILLTGGLTTFIINRYIRFVKRKEKQRAQRYSRLLQLKQRATNALIGPHFIFNSLNSIQYFINRSDQLSANRFLTRFASLIRLTMENSVKLNVSLDNEIKMLELYLSLEKMRLNTKLTYEIIVDERLDKSKVLLPSMLIQPYVENAVWHGITPKKSPGHIQVEIKRKDQTFLDISIQDDGIGINNALKQKKNELHQSFGMEINKSRLDIIEKITGYQIKVEILPMDQTGKAGTKVSLSVPYRQA